MSHNHCSGFDRVITIDGPASSGKGTVAKKLASLLTWHYLDSGLLYRCLAVAYCQWLIHGDDCFYCLTADQLTHAQASIVQQHHMNGQRLQQLALSLNLDFSLIRDNQGDIKVSVSLDGVVVDHHIATETVGNLASRLAAMGAVRQALLQRQRRFHRDPGLVTDGRDMGTVVFPKAILKIYLVADLEKRVIRRYQQLKNQGIDVNLKDIKQDLSKRDARDKERSIAPLCPAKGAVIIDNTNLSIEQVLDTIRQSLIKRLSNGV